MEELKQMLKIIHEENKMILSFLCSDGTNFEEVCNEMDKMYDELFYGKEFKNATD